MYKIISDGSCDLGDLAKAHDVDIVPFYVAFEGEDYKKEIEEVGIRDFYESMVQKAGVYPKSSLPSVEDYIKAFMPYVEKKQEILCICITTKFSGSYNSAINAKDIILDEHPDAVIEIIDAQVNTVLQGLLVLEAVKMRDAGWTLADTVKRVEEIKSTGRILFTVGSMDYLVHGGRAGKVAGAMVETLGIKPLIVLEDGEIHLGGIARGRKKSMAKVVSLIDKHFKTTGENPADYVFCVGFGYDKKEGENFLDMVKEATGRKDIDLFQIGATIAVHTGPYPLGVGLIKKAIL